MTNKLKLKEILEKFEQEFPNMTTMQGEYYYGVPFEVKKDIKNFICSSCIAYGKSLVTDIPTLKYTANEKEEGLNYGINLVLNKIQDRISQDELSLGEEDT